jgi:hypothetical protein
MATPSGTVQGYTASSIAGRTYPISLASGDTGVRAITSYTSSISMSSGTIGLVLRRKIAAITATQANMGFALDFVDLGGPQVYDDACIELLWQASSTTATTIIGGLSLAQG